MEARRAALERLTSVKIAILYSRLIRRPTKPQDRTNNIRALLHASGKEYQFAVRLDSILGLIRLDDVDANEESAKLLEITMNEIERMHGVKKPGNRRKVASDGIIRKASVPRTGLDATRRTKTLWLYTKMVTTGVTIPEVAKKFEYSNDLARSAIMDMNILRGYPIEKRDGRYYITGDPL